MPKFKYGFLAGGIIGAGLMWLGVSSRGKELRAKVALHLEPLAHELKESLRQLEGPTREMYDALVERVVEEYSARKELAMEVKNGLVRELKRKWDEIKESV